MGNSENTDSIGQANDKNHTLVTNWLFEGATKENELRVFLCSIHIICALCMWKSEKSNAFSDLDYEPAQQAFFLKQCNSMSGFM